MFERSGIFTWCRSAKVIFFWSVVGTSSSHSCDLSTHNTQACARTQQFFFFREDSWTLLVSENMTLLLSLPHRVSTASAKFSPAECLRWPGKLAAGWRATLWISAKQQPDSASCCHQFTAVESEPVFGTEQTVFSKDKKPLCGGLLMVREAVQVIMEVRLEHTDTCPLLVSSS